MMDYKELYIQKLAETLPKGAGYNIGTGDFVCYTGTLGYAAFDAALKEKVYYDYMKYTEEEVQQKFKESLEELENGKEKMVDKIEK